MEIRILTEKSDMAPLFPLIRQLSPKVTEERYLFLLDDMLAHGYRMIAAYLPDGTCVGLSGLWTATKIYSGKYMEMDNVVVEAQYRSMGVGQQICDFISDLAAKENVEMLMLDAYRENVPAHNFYGRNGFVKRGFHFLKAVGGWALEHPPVLPADMD
jgi:GNAT superfamily N-acetyltransferase